MLRGGDRRLRIVGPELTQQRPGHEGRAVRRGAQLLQVHAAARGPELPRPDRIAAFPDPTLTPLPNPADHSAVIDRSAVVTAIPKSIDTSPPAFKQAA
jgi:hypothetical protein